MIGNVIYLDIETIPSERPWVRDMLAEKITPPASIKKEETLKDWHKDKKPKLIDGAMSKAGLDGLTNHIVCVSVALNDHEPESFYIDDVSQEKSNLEKLYKWIDCVDSPTFVGHNISGFDFKVLRKRSIILNVRPTPKINFNAKPWDFSPYDTMIQWDSKSFVSMNNLAIALGIKGKDGMKGSDVWQAWKDGRQDDIAEYCADDVRMVRAIYKRMKFNQ